jgi:uncharacterized protein YwgA/O-acetyl-ADP-ribose deacetylase (regulator of RNase III)
VPSTPICFSGDEVLLVKVLIGDMFASNAQTLVNTVNCVGIMGKGVALAFKQHFPDMFEDYVRRCEHGLVKLGQPYLCTRITPPWVLNFPTKEHWRSVSRLEDIVHGLEYLEDHYLDWGITSLAVPPLGCGHGQLEWRVVGSTLYRYLKRLAIPVELYAPFGTPHNELQPTFLDSASAAVPVVHDYRIEPGLIALIEILKRIESEPYHWPVGRTMFQKIAYFATESGIPTGLTYQRGSYGPYAAHLKQIESKLINNGLIREERLGRMFAVRVGQTYNDARRAYATHFAKWEPIIGKLSDLFMRMQTDQAEIAATVHFVARDLKRQNDAASESDVLRGVMEWKQKRRPPLAEKQVAGTIRHLNILSWLNVQPSDDLPITEEDLLNV